MRDLRLPIITLACFWISGAALANANYNQGDEFARGIQGQSQSAIGGFDPAGALPNYNATPPESGYYGGVTNASTDLTSQGHAALNQSDVGKAITESILNTPTGNKPDMDAPFISVGREAQEGAERVTDGSFDGCVERSVTQTEYTNHVCARDTRVDQYCSRTATITGDWKEHWVEKDVSVSYTATITRDTYCASGCGGNHTERTGYRVSFSFVIPISEQFTGVYLSTTSDAIAWSTSLNGRSFSNVRTPGNSVQVPFSPNPGLRQGDGLSGHVSSTGGWPNPGNVIITLTYKTRVKERYFEPRLVWSESCPFDKAEGVFTQTECTEPGGNRTIYVEGKPYTMYSDCWSWRDTYLTQSASEGSCSQYIHNPACTVANRQCAYALDGFCLRENLTYSCEHNTTGSGVMCGGTFFCKDGSCAQAAAGKNNAFQKAVSQLAAVAAAGKDVAALNGADVRAFSGRAQFCKKFAAGFNNCCKDSGWGQDVGLASCSSEEKALGQARERKLVVDVGEFCSKKVLKICVEKKRSYCVFDSKLAQIVQQQGRQWQLGIGFGGAESPDCRGITPEQLQAINFNNLDFSNFYDDLKNGTTVPQDNALIQRVQQQIQSQVQTSQLGAKP